jgi:hypothetical protein
VSVSWQAEPAERALQQLAEELGVPLWLPGQTPQALQNRRVTLQGDHLTAGQAVRWLARLCGLRAVDFGQDIYVLQQPGGSAAWELACQGQGAELGESPSPWPMEPVPLNVQNATAMAAVTAIGRAFDVNVACYDSVRSCQALVTLQSPAMTLAEATAAWSAQTDLQVSWLDGVYVFGRVGELPAWAVGAPRAADKGHAPSERFLELVEARRGVERTLGLSEANDLEAATQLMKAASAEGPQGAPVSGVETLNH